MESRYIGDENEISSPKCNKCGFKGSGISCDKYGTIPRSILNGETCEYYKKRV